MQVVPLSRWRKEGYFVSAVGHAFDVSDEVGEAALRAATQANHTGNHYRNHSIKVPIAPGEPLRG